MSCECIAFVALQNYAGILVVARAQALGLGDVVVNGGVLGAAPQTINVKGNYTQNAGGTLQLGIGGMEPQ
jgi:hypothetical protein